MSKEFEKNEFYLNFLLQTSDHCFNLCVNQNSFENPNPSNFSNKLTDTEKHCVEGCFSKYYLAYNNVGDLVNDNLKKSNNNK